MSDFPSGSNAIGVLLGAGWRDTASFPPQSDGGPCDGLFRMLKYVSFLQLIVVDPQIRPLWSKPFSISSAWPRLSLSLCLYLFGSLCGCGCLAISVSVSRSVSVSVSLPGSIYLCLCLYLSVCITVCLCRCIYVCLSGHISLSVSGRISLPVSVSASICLSACRSLFVLLMGGVACFRYTSGPGQAERNNRIFRKKRAVHK